MRNLIAGAMIMGFVAVASPATAASWVTEWLTTADRSQVLQQQHPIALSIDRKTLPTITVDDSRAYQTIEGFGYALTGGSAQLIMAMSPVSRKALLREVFGNGEGCLDVRSIRISIGSSDLDDHIFSYDDRPAGETDEKLQHFSLAPDRRALIPLLRERLAIQPGIHILASPWSPPLWMKSNGLPKAGNLKPEAYDAFARYLVRYVQEMHAAGVPVEAITLQNEPQYLKNTPSMWMPAEVQADLIGRYVGPALKKAGLNTKILAYDHNPNNIDYPIKILRDPIAAPFVYGTAFHLYEGPAAAISTVHDAFPSKPIYLTEIWVTDDIKTGKPVPLADPVSKVMIGSLRNWVEGVILWNLAADPQLGPHTPDGGCTECQGAFTIDGDKVSRHAAYYTLAHASRFVKPGARRIATSGLDEEVPSVAFRRTDGRTVLLAANRGTDTMTFAVANGKRNFVTSLPPGSAATFVW